MFSRWEYHRWRQRRRRRRAFVLLVALVIGLGASAGQYASSGHSHSSRATTGKRPSGNGHQHEAKGRRAASASSNTVTTAGTALTWTSFHGVQLPSSPQDGPHHARSGLAWGFTDTPRGALLAAINVTVRTAALWGSAIFAPTVHRQVVGPDADTLLKADYHDYGALRSAGHVRRGQPAGRGYAAEAAWRFDSFTPTVATVDIVAEGPGTNGGTVMAATRVEVVWQRGDWRVVAPPGGDWANSATTITSLTGYTSFTSEG